MARAIDISPSEFASLTPNEQREIQVKEANTLLGLSLSGQPLTQSEQDFIRRILQKKIPSIEPDFQATVVGTTVSNIGEAFRGLRGNLLVPIIAILTLIFLLRVFPARK